MNSSKPTYDDGAIRCDEQGLRIRCYYPWGAKQIPYDSIRGVTAVPLTGLRGRWRIWGSGDLRHWWNLDPRRPRKRTALVLDVGHWVKPTITPEDPEAVVRCLGR